MRRKLYFVLYPSEETQSQIKDLITHLRKDNPISRSMPIDWAESNFKIPLIYLGAVSDEGKAAAIEAAEEGLKEGYPFEVKTSFISYFYKEEKRSGSLLFLTITDLDKNIKNIHKVLSANLREKGFSPATHFLPHIPIGRLKRQREDYKQKQMLDDLSQLELPNSISFVLDSIELLDTETDDILFTRESRIKSFPLTSSN
jgi:2'-5' RNA ligase